MNNYNSRSTDRFNNLYEDHTNRMLKKEKMKTQIDNKFDFHPKINPISDMMCMGISFDDRLQKYQY